LREPAVGDAGIAARYTSVAIGLPRAQRERTVMRWVRFSTDGRTAYGLLEGERVAEVSGDPFDSYARTGRVHALAAVRIEVPVIPRTFYCVGLNYTAHIIEQAKKYGAEPSLPEKPDIGYRAVNALVAHGEPVVIPRDATEKVQYEGELVVVIGKTAKHLSEADALSCVLGYTIGNDVSERSWQKSDRTMWRAKNTDTFKPMGPWIETAADLAAMETIVRLNGRESIRFRTNEMLFGVATFISAMTRYLTLYPGDVIWMGTDGVSPNLKAGDVVEVEITGIGTLRNPFVAEAER
jgi:2-keto-4-pentenoate hydratase/2-oxohepta-3-ene-1,7-dioic acid hydratase in catechol pathway